MSHLFPLDIKSVPREELITSLGGNDDVNSTVTLTVYGLDRKQMDKANGGGGRASFDPARPSGGKASNSPEGEKLGTAKINLLDLMSSGRELSDSRIEFVGQAEGGRASFDPARPSGGGKSEPVGELTVTFLCKDALDEINRMLNQHGSARKVLEVEEREGRLR